MEQFLKHYQKSLLKILTAYHACGVQASLTEKLQIERKIGAALFASTLGESINRKNADVDNVVYNVLQTLTDKTFRIVLADEEYGPRIDEFYRRQNKRPHLDDDRSRAQKRARTDGPRITRPSPPSHTPSRRPYNATRPSSPGHTSSRHRYDATQYCVHCGRGGEYLSAEPSGITRQTMNGQRGPRSSRAGNGISTRRRKPPRRNSTAKRTGIRKKPRKRRLAERLLGLE